MMQYFGGSIKRAVGWWVIALTSLLFSQSFAVLATNAGGADLIGDMTIEQLFSGHAEFARQYEDFEVEVGLAEFPDDATVMLFFGTWCHDSQREVPRLLKIFDSVDFKSERLTLIGLDYQKREPKGRAQLFGVRYTPTAVFFRDGIEVGRIIERPETTLQAEIARMFSNDMPGD